MKKNNKGFTLIELLAVIVIMGILAIMVIPNISNLVVQTREDIYVQDAKKLMAQAQYRMSSNSVDIEKPEIGECIVFSLKFLSSNDFRNPPNDGSYMDESSFVVVRNEDGNFEYAVLLIEARKDGLYQGVEFVTEKQLNARDAIKHVRFFDERDIRYIDIIASDNNGGDFLDTSFINNQLSRSGVGTTNWVEDNSIIGTYNDTRMKEGTVADASTPKFSAKINSSGSTDEHGALIANLTISAIDTDDTLSTLTVCTKIEKDDKASYPIMATDPTLCESYGERNYYTKEINFSNYGFSYTEGQIAFVYITVTDPSGNMSRKIVEHTIHQNLGPVISKMEFTRRVGDQVNLPTALLTVDVNDDLDSLDDLRVCFQQDTTDFEQCYGDYQSYYSYFDHNNHFNYTFRDDNNKPITNPDGSTHTLVMFVKDKDDKVSVSSAKYTIFKNDNPEIASVSIESCRNIGGFNSLNYLVNVVATDDFNENKLMIKIGDNEPMKYSDYLIRYVQARQCTRAPGFYNGKNREIIVEVWDEFQSEEDATFTSVILSNVYLNVAPEMNSVKISGRGKLCLDDKKTICTNDGNNDELGGTYEARVNIDTFDELLGRPSEYQGHVAVCINEDPSYCAEDKVENSSCISSEPGGCDDAQEKHFQSYKASYDYDFALPENEEDKYVIDDVRNLYVALYESEQYGDEFAYYYKMYGPYEYKIYKNQAPYFVSSNYEITTAAPYSIANFKDVLTNFSNVVVHDDFNQYTLSFCYSIDGGEKVCTEPLGHSEFISKYGTYFTFKNADGSDIEFYEGQRIDTYLVVEDQFGLTDESEHFVYVLHADEAPDIRSVNVKSNSTVYNTNFIYVAVSVVDIGDTYKVCVIEDGAGECSDADYKGKNSGDPFSGDYVGRSPSVATITFDGAAVAGWSTSYDEANPKKYLRVFVKDSRGKVTEYGQRIEYELYTSCVHNIKLLRTEYTLHAGENALTMNYCNGLCYHTSPSPTLVSNNNVSSLFDKYIYNKDTLISYECPAVVETEDKYCNYNTCFEPGNKDPYYIGLTVLSKQTEWTDSPEGELVEHVIEKPYCEELISNNEIIFNKKDARCTNSSYCQDYAELVCLDEEDDEEAYQACMQTYLNKCSTALGKFCNKDLDESWHEISCNGADLTDPNVEKHVCRKDFLEGVCIEDSPVEDCYENDPGCSEEEIEEGTCPQVMTSSCWNKCYKKENCAVETEMVQAVVTCHGYLYLYKKTYRNNKFYLANTGLKICPEVLTRFPDHYRYDSSAERPYIMFNEEEQLSIVDLTSGGDNNG